MLLFSSPSGVKALGTYTSISSLIIITVWAVSEQPRVLNAINVTVTLPGFSVVKTWLGFSVLLPLLSPKFQL